MASPRLGVGRGYGVLSKEYAWRPGVRLAPGGRRYRVLPGWLVARHHPGGWESRGVQFSVAGRSWGGCGRQYLKTRMLPTRLTPATLQSTRMSSPLRISSVYSV